ncbi:MAG: hypothetical protein KJ058_13025 [Thermoanaerobaculia bacterium]|nr:hypothetical protein [Thermoanaerobaculia bacterium]
MVRVYECHTQAGCRSHDDCLDRCAERYPGEARSPDLPGSAENWVDQWIAQGADWRPERNFYTGACSSCCHVEAFRTYGWEGAGSLWKDGFESTVHPRDGVIRFEYTKEFPSQEEEIHRCPERFRLKCDERGRAECVLDEVIVDVGPDWPCIGVGERQTMFAEVLGTENRRVEWSVVEGPGTIDTEGVLAGTGEGEVRVRGTSLADESSWDEATVRVGTCACAFEATVAGDSNRGRVGGETANFSTRGATGAAASGGLGGEAAGDFLADLAGLMQQMGGAAGGNPEATARLAEELSRKAGGSDAGTGAAPRGRTVTMSFVGRGGGPLSPGTFQLDLLAEASIEPGFAGPLPVKRVFVSTGERAAEGGAPWIFLWEEGRTGSASIRVESYNGDWLVGRLEADLEGAEGLLIGGRRPRISVGLEFTAGAMNPLQMQNVCLLAKAGSGSGK